MQDLQGDDTSIPFVRERARRCPCRQHRAFRGWRNGLFAGARDNLRFKRDRCNRKRIVGRTTALGKTGCVFDKQPSLRQLPHARGSTFPLPAPRQFTPFFF